MFAYLHAMDAEDYLKNSFIVIFDPQNMGLDTIFVQLFTTLVEIWPNIVFGVMVAKEPILIVFGTAERKIPLLDTMRSAISKLA